jgi:hypothetical protein
VRRFIGKMIFVIIVEQVDISEVGWVCCYKGALVEEGKNVLKLVFICEFKYIGENSFSC